MAVSDYVPPHEVAPPVLSKGENYEKIAFNFCKAATIILFTGKFALPIAAGAAAVFYLLAHFNGKTDSRCILQKPLLIATFWGTICLAWLFIYLRPLLGH